jgi:hypothetical protein
MEGSLASDHGVEDNEKFTNTCGKRLLSRFASRTQARIELFQSGIAVNCDYLTHAQSSMATATCCESAISSRSHCANSATALPAWAKERLATISHSRSSTHAATLV